MIDIEKTIELARNGDVDAMIYIGQHYTAKKNYEEMKKYYMMAIKLNNSTAMNNFGAYYHTAKINYEKNEKILYDGHQIE